MVHLFIYALEKSNFFNQLCCMYNAIDLPLFVVHISLEMRINKYIFGSIVLHVLHVISVNLYHFH